MIRAKIEKQKDLEERLSNIEYLLFLYGESSKELHKKK